MAYYPKSQIKTNLYTNGGTYVLSSTQESYIGYYYMTSLGQLYTGKNPQDGPNSLLVPIEPTFEPSTIDPDNVPTDNRVIDLSISPLNPLEISVYGPVLTDPLNKKILNGLSNRYIPQFNPTLPTDKDKSLGVFSRYFCKKNNELIYKEINKETFTKLRQQSQDIAWDLYTPQTILWYIKGDKEKTYNANKGMVVSLEQKQNWYGFSQYLKEDYLRYYLES